MKIQTIILMFALTSCSNSGIYLELAESFKQIISSPKDVSLEKIESIPYASIQVRIGKGQNALIILEEANEEYFKWTSSNLIKIYTRNGYIIKFKGLENQLQDIILDEDHPFNKKDFNFINEKTYTSYYNFSNPNLFDLPIKTSFKFIKSEDINLFGKIVSTDVYEEKSLENLIRWNFKNTFWIDQNKEIVKSIQNVTPKIESIYISRAKKYKKP